MTSRADLDREARAIISARVEKDLAKYEATLRTDEYAAAMNIGMTKLYAQLRTGRCEVPPRMVRPYRWLKADLHEHLVTVTIATDRRAKHAADRRGQLRAVGA